MKYSLHLGVCVCACVCARVCVGECGVWVCGCQVHVWLSQCGWVGQHMCVCVSAGGQCVCGCEWVDSSGSS